MPEYKILFCCMGNICRSPMAEGLFKAAIKQAGLEDWCQLDSAGTHAYFPDAPPDPRAQATMAGRGIDISQQRARRVLTSDFERYDLILAVDAQTHDFLRIVCPKPLHPKILRLLDFASGVTNKDIPDPYHRDQAAFTKVLELLDAAVDGFIPFLRERLEC
jgi:protein-tyrosine phosphatase